MTIHQIYPEECNTTAQNVIADAVKVNKTPLAIGDRATKEFCALLSRLLLEEPRAAAYPELTALGFWLRPSSISQMLAECLPFIPGTTRVPAGIVFQIPPSNVDTLFGYNAIISLLCGNTTLVRLSRSVRTVQQLLVDFIQHAISSAPPELHDRLILMRYDPNEITTSTLSNKCHLRMVWGGDITVSTIRSVNLPPLAHDASFADRFSSSVICTSAYLAASENGRNDLVRKFATDLYLFDQHACSSPRLLLWIGRNEDSDKAETDFYNRLATSPISVNYDVDASVSLSKLSHGYLALHDLPVINRQVHSPALTTISLENLDQISTFKRIPYGYGMLLTAHLDKLDDLAAYTETCDQTLSYWGFSQTQIQDFVQVDNGKGFVRYTPIGEALAFDPVWDGINLFETMTKMVRVRG